MRPRPCVFLCNGRGLTLCHPGLPSPAPCSRAQWLVAAALLSLGVSVKMNVLLFVPGFAYLLARNASKATVVAALALMVALQALLGAPFLATYPREYVGRAFELSRVFMPVWTVNWRFLPVAVFTSGALARALLLGHLSTLLVAAHALWSVRDGGVLSMLRRRGWLAWLPRVVLDVLCGVPGAGGAAAATSTAVLTVNSATAAARPPQLAPAASATVAPPLLLARPSQRRSRSRSTGAAAAAAAGPSAAAAGRTPASSPSRSPRRRVKRAEGVDGGASLAVGRTPAATTAAVASAADDALYIATVLYTSNFIGIAFARTLHYQFLLWYWHALPFLLWRTRVPVVVRLAVLAAVEYAFNVGDAAGAGTPWSSAVLQAAHLALLVGILAAPGGGAHAA